MEADTNECVLGREEWKLICWNKLTAAGAVEGRKVLQQKTRAVDAVLSQRSRLSHPGITPGDVIGPRVNEKDDFDKDDGDCDNVLYLTKLSYFLLFYLNIIIYM